MDGWWAKGQRGKICDGDGERKVGGMRGGAEERLEAAVVGLDEEAEAWM
jgi:hypothetical protein